MEQYREMEKSIIKKYRKDIWSKFISAVKEYELIQENDKIAVCISGGKDSMLLAKCMQELQRHGQIKFEVEYITMDPGYHPDNIDIINKNAKEMNIPLTIFKSNIFEVVSKYAPNEPCYMCARMRRGHLYNKAKELGCNKIALAHHYDDVIETILLNMFYNGSYKTMMPKLKSDNFEDMELIRPFYFVRENIIEEWVKYNNLKFIDCGCMITVCSTATKRYEIKGLIKKLEEENPLIIKNIFKSSENVNIDAILGYKKDKKSTSFLEEYDL